MPNSPLVRIRSMIGNAALELGDPLPTEPHFAVTSCCVTLAFEETFVSLRARTRISTAAGAELADYFDELAAARAGWAGLKSWAARERELVLTADHEGNNRVALTVELCPEYHPPPFTAHYRLMIDARSLEELAREIRGFLRA